MAAKTRILVQVERKSLDFWKELNQAYFRHPDLLFYDVWDLHDRRHRKNLFWGLRIV